MLLASRPASGQRHAGVRLQVNGEAVGWLLLLLLLAASPSGRREPMEGLVESLRVLCRVPGFVVASHKKANALWPELHSQLATSTS